MRIRTLALPTVILLAFSLAVPSFAADAVPKDKPIITSAELPKADACDLQYNNAANERQPMLEKTATVCSKCAYDAWNNYVKFCCYYTLWGNFCNQVVCSHLDEEVLK
jgi:hypothetical protein